MFKVASAHAQGRASRVQISDIAGHVPDADPEHLRQNLVRQLKALEVEILTEENRVRRKELGLKKLALQGEITAIRAKRKDTGASQHFIDAAREILTSGQFKLVMAEATRRAGILALEDQGRSV